MAAFRKMTLAEWRAVAKPFDQYIIQASRTDGSDGWVNYPIGMAYGFMTIGELGRAEIIQQQQREKLVYANFSRSTDKKRRGFSGVTRESIKLMLEENGIKFQKSVAAVDYYKQLSKYKFVVSPEGNGIDCHRHYEALMAGCIPIVEEHPGIREKYRGCPIIFTRDYSEITPEYLENVYDSMMRETYDFSRLFMSSYSEKEQTEIRNQGNYWCLRLAGCLPYVEA
jgi:hypothetical protein